MAELGALATLMGVAKIAADIASASSEAERNKLLVEFQKSVIAANFQVATLQQSVSALMQENEELKREATRKKDWEAESKRYMLYKAAEGLVVYALKESMSNGEPPHYLCANCFSDGKKTVLYISNVPGSSMKEAICCKTCGTHAPTGYSGGSSPKFPENS